MTQKFTNRSHRRSFCWLHRMVLRFLRLVWREWEPASCGIPDGYRIHYRLSVKDAWEIASGVWAQNAPDQLSGDFNQKRK
jgi:hypothetical protein